MSERDRQSLISAIVDLHKLTDSIAGQIVRAELEALPEHSAAAEKAAQSFIVKLRMLN